MALVGLRRGMVVQVIFATTHLSPKTSNLCHLKSDRICRNLTAPKCACNLRSQPQLGPVKSGRFQKQSNRLSRRRRRDMTRDRWSRGKWWLIGLETLSRVKWWLVVNSLGNCKKILWEKQIKTSSPRRIWRSSWCIVTFTKWKTRGIKATMRRADLTGSRSWAKRTESSAETFSKRRVNHAPHSANCD